MKSEITTVLIHAVLLLLLHHQEFIKKEISDYFTERNIPSNVKYIDPSYMIRSVPANASDAMFCLILAQNAVHGAMAGFTAFSVGLVNNRVVYIPISRCVSHVHAPKEWLVGFR